MPSLLETSESVPDQMWLIDWYNDKNIFMHSVTYLLVHTLDKSNIICYWVYFTIWILQRFTYFWSILLNRDERTCYVLGDKALLPFYIILYVSTMWCFVLWFCLFAEEEEDLERNFRRIRPQLWARKMWF